MTTRRTRLGMIGTAIAALIAPLTVAVLATPAEAAVDRRAHHLETYRLEKTIELEGGEEAWTYLGCRAGDIAVDGMWRVDNVDDPNPQLGMFGDERDVLALASYGDTDARYWLFRFLNGADGRAQLKIFVVCLEGQTVTQWGHSHNLVLDPRQSGTLSDVGVGAMDYGWVDRCGTDQILVAPGFSINDGTARSYGSWPEPNYRGWHWGFVSHHATTDINLYARCLDVKTGSTLGHRHNILSYFTHGSAGSFLNLPVTDRTERQLTCDTHYWGAVGAWWVSDPHHVWHLGSDPRPVTRAHSFWNDGGGGHGSYLTLRCLGKRTSHGFS
ncbi:hypothetical protein SAMN05192576_2693 [Nocardioides szechwanensis]|uniref:Uncharacterized protein n=1 Tax=Nocardioides szechwanensis TaxID=1005944 RepID=A0A1H0DWN3_9ACTN|nr:hypothetical protein [Nocardioides szechwanensis]SDN74667.1 hypothetical protein SAMN05192576_2693 [Nocardioides szechwanensis]